jgi:hypothetical protein
MRRRLPPYAHRPGRTPHPRRDPRGHSFGRPEPTLRCFDPARWREDEDWLHGLALFAAGFWWEAHEVFEGLAHAFGRAGPEGRLLRALVQLAAAELKHEAQGPAARRLASRARNLLAGLPDPVLGVRVAALAAAINAAHEAGAPGPVDIPLESPIPELV